MIIRAPDSFYISTVPTIVHNFEIQVHLITQNANEASAIMLEFHIGKRVRKDRGKIQLNFDVYISLCQTKERKTKYEGTYRTFRAPSLLQGTRYLLELQHYVHNFRTN